MHNKVIIWSADNYNSLGLLRQLGGRDIELFFLMMGKPVGCASASKFFPASHQVGSIEEGYQYLLSEFAAEEYKPIIITPSDEIIEFIDQHKAELSEKFLIPGTKVSGVLTRTDDKNNMVALAQKHGFLIPESRLCRWDSDISDMEYPCIIKPAHTTPGHRNEFKYKICKNEKALRKALKYVRHETDFVLQQYIPKESVALVYGARMTNGVVIIAGTLLKDRFAACGDGTHGRLTNQKIEGIEEEQIKSFLDEIDYCGLFSVEYGLYENKAYFFEVNLRNDGTSHFFYQVGANIPLAWVYDMTGEKNEYVPTIVQHDAYYIDEVFDVANVWNGTVKRREWKKQAAEATVFKYYDKNDVAPYESMKRNRLKKIMTDALLKKYRIYVVYLMDRFTK